MRYTIRDNLPVQISEGSGTIQNISNSTVEISNSADFTDSFLLYPLNQISFTEQLYIRAIDRVAQIIKVNVVPFVDSGGVVSSTAAINFVSDSKVAEYLESIFPVDSEITVVPNGFFQTYLSAAANNALVANSDGLYAEGYASDAEVNEYLAKKFGR